MTGYFDLLRKHQDEPAQQPPPPAVSEEDDHSSLLISEDDLPSEAGDAPDAILDDLLCEEEETASPTEDEKPSVADAPAAQSGTDETETQLPSAPETVPSSLPDDSHGDQQQREAADVSITIPPPLPVPDATVGDDKAEVSTHIAQWLQTFIAMNYAMFRQCRQNEPYDMKPLERHVTNLLLWLEREPELINALELELEQADFKQYARNGQDDLMQLVMKSVMMLLYALKTTAELKSPHDTRIRLLMASVLQHIGMAQVPPEILGKKGRLSPDELAEIREAPARGKAYLQRCGIEDEYLLRAADESNERVDGSGPRGLQGKEICYSARLVGLLSMFEAMIHVRSYRKRMLPREAVRVVVQKFKPAFEHAMLKALLDAISLYPIGSYVKLNSKEIGKVISCHPRLPLRPQVRITMDEYGNEIPPREIDLKKHPNLMIEQCAYEDDIKALMHEESG